MKLANGANMTGNQGVIMLLTRNDAFRVVFNLRTPISQNAEEFGTGLFVNKTDKELFLVTASHVAKTCNINTQVVISDQNGNSKSFRLLDFNPRLAWVHHPIADICALRIVPNDLIAPELSSRFFPYSQLNTCVSAPPRDDELTCVGFPSGLGIYGNFSPLTYRSFASSSIVNFPRSDSFVNCDFFLLENPSVGGYSGCPVFDLGIVVNGGMTTTKANTICYGIMHGTLGDNSGGKLSIVTPAYYITQII